MSKNSEIKLKYDKLSAIDANVLPQIKCFFINHFDEKFDVIFITKTDQVFGFGYNPCGRLGFGHKDVVNEPTIIPELCQKNVINVEFGYHSSIALTLSGDVYTFGVNSRGMIGNGQNPKRNECFKPQKININDQIVIKSKFHYSKVYLLTKSFRIYWFGENISNSPIPMKFLKGQVIQDISCVSNHILVLTVNGIVHSWGENSSGQLGLGHNTYTTDPQIIQILDVKQICCGNNHSLLLTNDGNLYSFGKNDCGQLGTGDNDNKNRPCLISSENKFKEINAFEDMSMALRESNDVYIWGKTKETKHLKPFKTNVNSFREAIRFYIEDNFNYGVITFDEMIVQKPINRINKMMAKLFNNPENSDLKFKIKRKGSEEYDYIYVQKCNIKANSEYFERMFANNWSENETKEIEINNYSFEAYYQYIRYLYTNSIETEDIELLIEMLSISDQYLDEELNTECAERIKTLISEENVCSLYSSALKNDWKQLERHCFQFMATNMSSIIKTEDYEKMESNFAKHFLSQFYGSSQKI